MSEEKARELPECPYHIAHPQSVWFEHHWRPLFNQLKKELEQVKGELDKAKVMNNRAYSLAYNTMKAQEKEIKGLKAELQAEREHGDRLENHVNHARLCAAVGGYDYCSCGLEELLEAHGLRRGTK